jgi:asparagine synthetase B (glutamine-hydrolysing)
MMLKGQEIDPRLVGEKQKTFSSCFKSCLRRAKVIELIIQQTNAEKNYVFPMGEGLDKDLSKLVWYQDEPFDSTSIYAQWNVMRLAKERGVTVLLDGQGGSCYWVISLRLSSVCPKVKRATLRSLKR